MSYLSDHFRKKRQALRLSIAQLARQAGYRNINKGVRRVQEFEMGGDAHEEFLGKLAVALDVDDATMSDLIEQDRQAHERWLDEPVEPSLVARVMAAFYSSLSIPPDIASQQDACEQYASAKAKELGLRVCLVWNRRLSVYFDRNGEVEGRHQEAPYMSVKGRKFLC